MIDSPQEAVAIFDRAMELTKGRPASADFYTQTRDARNAVTSTLDLDAFSAATILNAKGVTPDFIDEAQRTIDDIQIQGSESQPTLPELALALRRGAQVAERKKQDAEIAQNQLSSAERMVLEKLIVDLKKDLGEGGKDLIITVGSKGDIDVKVEKEKIELDIFYSLASCKVVIDQRLETLGISSLRPNIMIYDVKGINRACLA
jgi:hypothetical protein